MDERTIDRALSVNNDISAQVMAETLMNDTVSTYRMYDRLALAYLSGTDEFRRGLNKAVEIITDESLTSLAKRITDAGEASTENVKESIQEEIDRIFDRIPA